MSNTMNTMYTTSAEKTPENSTIDISSDEGEGSSKHKSPVELPNPNHGWYQINITKLHISKNIEFIFVLRVSFAAQVTNNTFRLSRELVVTKRTIGDLEQNPTQSESAPFASPPRHQQPPKKRKLDGRERGEEDKTTNGREAPSLSKLSKRSKRDFPMKYSNIDFKNVGGLEKTLGDLCELLMHIKHPEIYKRIGLPPPRGFLLHGAPGTGKTLLAQAIAGVCILQLIFYACSALFFFFFLIFPVETYLICLYYYGELT